MPDFLGANVHSLDALKDVRAALIRFQERAETAMSELRQKVDRTVDWLELDRPAYWKDQERRAYDEVATARVAYETCRLRTTGGRHSDCIEEKKAFERAEARMEYVRQKQEVVRKWMVQAGREANEYRAKTSTFQRAIENDVPLMIAQVGRMIDAIEAYAEIGSVPPQNTTPPSASSSSASSRVIDQTNAPSIQDEQPTVDNTISGPRTDADE